MAKRNFHAISPSLPPFNVPTYSPVVDWRLIDHPPRFGSSYDSKSFYVYVILSSKTLSSVPFSALWIIMLLLLSICSFYIRFCCMKECARWTRDIVTRSVSSIFEPDRWKNRCENRFWISFESNFKYLEPMRRSRPIFLGFDERIDEFIPSK